MCAFVCWCLREQLLHECRYYGLDSQALVCWQPPAGNSLSPVGEKVLTGNSPLTGLLDGGFSVTVGLHATLEFNGRV